ncbi:MAG: hypothetical protein AB1556_02150 [Bacillota bacterium]
MNNCYVTDTQVLIHYMEARKPISKKVNEIFEKADEGEVTIYIPAIVLSG